MSADPQWSVRVWRAEGLPEKAVVGLSQTSDRVFWIATPRFLTRFDGATFEPFNRSVFAPELSQNLQAILGSRDGSLWAATARGAVICLQSNRTQVFTNDLPEDEPQSLIEDGEGAIWISYGGGAVCRIRDGTVTRFSTPDVSPEGTTCSLACDGTGRVWFAKGSWVGVFADGKFQPQHRFRQRPGLRLAGSRKGGVWIAVRSELYRCDLKGGLENHGSFQSKLPNPRIVAVLEDAAGAVWVATQSQGLFRFDGSATQAGLRHAEVSAPLPSNSAPAEKEEWRAGASATQAGFEEVPVSHPNVTCLWEDHEGNLWAGTEGGGLNRIRREAITVEGGEAGLAGESLHSIGEDLDGAYWAGAKAGTLLSRSNGAWHPVMLSTTASKNVSRIAPDPAGGIWIGTGNFALHRLRHGELTTWLKKDGLRSHTIRALFVDRAGGVWIGGDGLISLQLLRDGRLEDVGLPAAAGCIRTITEDLAGNVWAGGDGGTLIRVSNGVVTDESTRHPAPGKSIRCVYPLPDGSVWLTFDGGGIGRVREGTFGMVRPEQGLPDEYPAQIIADGRGWFWFTSPSGLFRVRQREMEDASKDRQRRVQPVRLEIPAGLQPDLDQLASTLRSRDGRLWIPMGTALVIVRPDFFRDQSEPPAVLVTRVAVDEKPRAVFEPFMPVPPGAQRLRPDARLALSPKHRRVEFAFTALSFSVPENVHFRYRLEGFDEDWTEANLQRRVSFSRLPAGDYRFQVTACNSDGVWNNSGAAVAFTVTPFLWQRWWFQLAACASFAGAMIAFGRYISLHRLRSRLRVIEQQAALDRERTRIARDLHDDLGSRLTEILLLSRRALHPRDATREPEALVQQIEAKARLGIKSLDETVWAVTPSNDTLAHLINYVAQFAVTFLQTAGIRFRLEAPDHLPDRPLPVEARHHLLLVVKEALNNVVRHAQAGEVRLRVAVSAESLDLAIEDDGRGFAEAPADGMADGLRNMRQRIEEIGGDLSVESIPGSGTKIRLNYPWPERKQRTP